MKVLVSFICLLIAFESKSQDTLSIDQFDSIVIKHQKNMYVILETNDTLSVLEAINLIRIENTLSFGV